MKYKLDNAQRRRSRVLGGVLNLPWKYVGVRVCFDPRKMSHYFIQKLSVNYSASFVSSKMKDSCQEWKVKLIFSRRRKQFDGLIWPTLTLNPPPPYILRQIYATANANVSITSLTKVMKRNWNRKPQEQTKLRVLLRAHDIQQDRINTTGHSQRNTQQPRPAVRAWNIHDCISTKKNKTNKNNKWSIIRRRLQALKHGRK